MNVFLVSHTVTKHRFDGCPDAITWMSCKCTYITNPVPEFCFNIFVGRLKKSCSREKLETVRNPTWLSKKETVGRYDVGGLLNGDILE